MDETELPVAIVGAGFSGTLLAINLGRFGAKTVLIEEDSDRLGKGLAFGTRRPEHLLNVRVSNMSAFPDDPGHFQRWLGYSTHEEANRFVARLTYGRYLQELLTSASGQRDFSVISGLATDVGTAGGVQFVRLADGRQIPCRAVVLAMGNLAPRAHPILAELPDGTYFPNPWLSYSIPPGDEDGHVLLLGTGLTAIDVTLSLAASGYSGRITALSRRGLHPLAHAESGPLTTAVPCPAAKGSWLVREVRRRADEKGWRTAVDELRQHTQQMWRRHDIAAQRRFLRHLRPYWDVHRHRLAPDVAARIAQLEASGQFEVRAGKLVKAIPDIVSGRVQITWRERGGDSTVTISASRVIGCTGPDGDIGQATNPLLKSLLAEGRLRADPHRLGLEIDRTGRVLSTDGTPQSHIFAVGPLTKGEAWEIIAVPDIRRQVWHLARYLTSSHWIGGEGL